MNEAITAGRMAVNEIRDNSANLIAGGAIFCTGLIVGRWSTEDKNYLTPEDINCFNTLQSIYATHYGEENTFFKMAPKEHKTGFGESTTREYTYHKLDLSEYTTSLHAKCNGIEKEAQNNPLAPVLRSIINLFSSILKQNRSFARTVFRGQPVRWDGPVVMFFAEMCDWIQKTSLHSMAPEEVENCVSKRVNYLKEVKTQVINQYESSSYRTPYSVLSHIIKLLNTTIQKAKHDYKNITFQQHLKHFDSDIDALSWAALCMVYVSCDAAKKSYEPTLLMQSPSVRRGESTDEDCYLIDEYKAVKQTKIGHLLLISNRLMGVTSNQPFANKSFSYEMIDKTIPKDPHDERLHGNLGILESVPQEKHNDAFKKVSSLIRLVLELHILRIELSNCMSLAERLGDMWIFKNPGAQAATKSLLLHIEMISTALHKSAMDYGTFICGHARAHKNVSKIADNDPGYMFIIGAVERFTTNNNQAEGTLISRLKKRIKDIETTVTDMASNVDVSFETRSMQLCFLKNILALNQVRCTQNDLPDLEASSREIEHEIANVHNYDKELITYFDQQDEMLLSVKMPASDSQGLKDSGESRAVEAAVHVNEIQSAGHPTSLTVLELNHFEVVKRIMDGEEQIEEVKEYEHLIHPRKSDSETRWDSEILKDVNEKFINPNQSLTNWDYATHQTYVTWWLAFLPESIGGYTISYPDLRRLCVKDPKRFERLHKRVNRVIHYSEDKIIEDLEQIVIEKYLKTTIQIEIENAGFFFLPWQHDPVFNEPKKIAIEDAGNGVVKFKYGDKEGHVLGLDPTTVDRMNDFNGYKKQIELKDRRIKVLSAENSQKQIKLNQLGKEIELKTVQISKKNAQIKALNKRVSTLKGHLSDAMDDLRNIQFMATDGVDNQPNGSGFNP